MRDCRSGASLAHEATQSDQLRVALEGRASVRDVRAVSSAQLQAENVGAHAGSHKSGEGPSPALTLDTGPQLISIRSGEGPEWARSAHSGGVCSSQPSCSDAVSRCAAKLQARRCVTMNWSFGLGHGIWACDERDCAAGHEQATHSSLCQPTTLGIDARTPREYVCLMKYMHERSLIRLRSRSSSC